jgi:putative DNA-invertase from lambdoid prophage Rac
MRAILYARVSTGEQATHMQVAEMRAYCERNKWDVARVIEETESGANDQRPKRKVLLKDACKLRPGFQVIVVWKLDRWGRSTLDLLSTLTELHRVGIAFVSVTEQFDLSTPMGKAMAGMLAVFAQFERDMIQARVRAGIDRYREKEGKWGRPAKAREQRTTILLMLAQGSNPSAISDKLQISVASVYRVLRAERLSDTHPG